MMKSNHSEKDLVKRHSKKPSVQHEAFSNDKAGRPGLDFNDREYASDDLRGGMLQDPRFQHPASVALRHTVFSGLQHQLGNRGAQRALAPAPPPGQALNHRNNHPVQRQETEEEVLTAKKGWGKLAENIGKSIGNGAVEQEKQIAAETTLTPVQRAQLQGGAIIRVQNAFTQLGGPNFDAATWVALYEGTGPFIETFAGQVPERFRGMLQTAGEMFTTGYVAIQPVAFGKEETLRRIRASLPRIISWYESWGANIRSLDATIASRKAAGLPVDDLEMNKSLTEADLAILEGGVIAPLKAALGQLGADQPNLEMILGAIAGVPLLARSVRHTGPDAGRLNAAMLDVSQKIEMLLTVMQSLIDGEEATLLKVKGQVGSALSMLTAVNAISSASE